MAGMTMGPTAHGSLGFALMTAPTLADAIALTVRYVPVRSAAFSVEHYEEDGSAVIALHDRLPPGPFRHTVVTVLLMSFWRVSNDITGTTLVGNVDVTFPPPPGMDAFVAPLPGEIRFGQRENRMLFDRAFLDLPLVGADAASHQLAVEQCERERQKQPAGGLVFDVRVRLDASERDYPSLEAMASSLALSASTFKRRLREHGVVYRDLVEEHRRRTAERLLASSSISVEALAARLGYADGPCFARAFRRWTGRSPAEFRRTRSE
jgi:AraC-like DNA-binding protein